MAHNMSILALTLSILSLVASPAPAKAQAVTVSNLLPFTASDGNGFTIPAQGRDGKFYAVATVITAGLGSDFKFSAKGQRSTVYTFDPAASYNGISSLTLGSDGNFYGIVEATQAGIVSTNGELYKISSTGAYTLLHIFGTADGSYPMVAPIEASDGNFYGAAPNHGNISTVYKYTQSGQFSVIYTSTTDTGLGCNRVMQGTDGNLYVTCIAGGFKRNGTILKLNTAGKLLQNYKFPGGARGSYPVFLLQGTDDNIYGTTGVGGISQNGGYGTIFQFTPQGNVNTLYQFGSIAGSGQGANALIEGSDGNLYGVAPFGGANNLGTFFRCSTTGNYTDLYSFTSAVGSDPSSLMQSTTGLFYGSTYFTGYTSGYGGIFTANAGLAPFVSTVERASGVGKTVEILGQGFKGTTSVTFNGIAASSFSVASDTYLTAVVPTGATTGPVVVTSPTQTLTSNRNLTIR